jgi:hypothetical protein
MASILKGEDGSKYVVPHLMPGESVVWSARKSERLLRREAMTSVIVSLLGGGILTYHLVQLVRTLPYLSTDSWLETINSAIAILMICLLIIIVPFLIYQFIWNTFWIVQIVRAPRVLVYAITQDRVLKLMAGRKERMEGIFVRKCNVRVQPKEISFHGANPTLFEWVLLGGISMLGLTTEERQAAIGVIEQVWKKQ